MMSGTYELRRAEIETYFDRTALRAWAVLTSAAPVSGIRAKVRAGRDETRATLLSWLPADMTGLSLLDAGCGTGALALAAAARGANVTAIDLSPQLVALAAERAAAEPCAARVDFRAGDMLDPALGTFDYIVCMDSVIHYAAADVQATLAALRARARRGPPRPPGPPRAVLFTFAPRTPLLMTALTIGKIFPKKDRSPAIVPQSEKHLRKNFTIARSHRVSASVYTSQAMEMLP
jgi:magnesium-protoporphyrin O-methyltransferase